MRQSSDSLDKTNRLQIDREKDPVSGLELKIV